MKLIYKENYFENMTKRDRNDLIDILPIKEISRFFKMHKKFTNKFVRGFRVESIPKFKIKEIFNKIIEENKQEIFIFFIYDLLQKELKIIDDKIEKINNKKVKLTSSNLSKDAELLRNIITIILESNFKENIKLFFIAKEIRISLKLEKEIELLIQNKKLYYKLYNEIQETLNLEFSKQLSLKINEKNKIIYEKQENIRLLKSRETQLNIEIDKEKDNVLKLRQKLNFEKENLQCKITNLNLEVKEKEKEKEIIESVSNEKDILLEKIKNENKDLRNKLTSERSQLKKEIKSELELEENSLFDSFNEISELCVNEKKSLDKLREEYEDCKFNYEWVQERFSEDISKLKDFFNKSTMSENSIEGLNKQTTFNVEDDVVIGEYEECSEINDFEEILSGNLEKSGIINQYKVNLSKYLVSILANKHNILLIGYNSREIAHSIAITTFNQNAEVISFIDEANIFSQLINRIEVSDKKVILIENLIESISENIYMPILKNIKDKILIFSIENSDNIYLLNRSIFNYLIPIDLEFVSQVSKENSMIGSIFDFDIFDKRKSNYIVKMSKLIESRLLGNILDYILSDLIVTMVDLLEVDENIAYATVLQYSVYPLLKNKNKEKILLDIYEKNKNRLSKLEEFIVYIKEVNDCDE